MEKIYNHIFSLIPEKINFDFIAVKNESLKCFTLDNISDQTILFNIENAEGFLFEPCNGIIPRNKKTEIKIRIAPSYATVLESEVRITLDQKYSKIIQVCSISKYPYLNINKKLIEFGTLEIGHSSEEEIILNNMESVPATFSIKRTSTQPGKQPCMFYISNLVGEIPPKSNFALKILYKPMFPNNNSYETFLITTKGGNKVNFACKGNCLPLKTRVGVQLVNFNSVALGSQMKKLFRIYNDSDLPTEFQIYHDNSGAFIFDILEGVINGKSNIRINVTFKPYETMMYYQRVFCLLRNHTLFPIDLYGSCHNLLIKTPLINMKSLLNFRDKEINGFYMSHNGDFLNSNNSYFNKTFTGFDKNSLGTNSLKTNELKLNTQPQLHKEMFWENYSKTRLISFDTDFIDFNFMQNGSVSEPFILKVYNNSNENMNVKFIYDKPVNLNNLITEVNIFHSESTVFFTQPEEKIINKFSYGEFKIYFKPNKSEFYFYSDLPCQATFVNSKKPVPYLPNKTVSSFPKVNRQLTELNKNQLSKFGKNLLNHNKKNSDSLSKLQSTKTIKPNQKPLNSTNNVNKIKNSILESNKTMYNKISENKDKSIIKTQMDSEILDPPVTLSISLVGHSFPPGTQIFIPMLEMDPNKEIFFPPATINQSLYQTLKISNKNDTPLFYKLTPDPQGIFRTHNKHGLIPSHSFHLICLEFCPKDTTVYQFPLKINFNHDSQNTKTIILNGLCTDPVIDVEGISNEMYFPPSYVGIKTKKTVIIKNISPIKINVNINITDMQNALVEVSEKSFEMDTNLIKKIDFYLTPTIATENHANVIITAERVHDPSYENIGVYNPTYLNEKNKSKNENLFDKRTFTKKFEILGRGSDGDLQIKPNKLNFGTVKVGFHKEITFSIFNPTITNFYIKLVPDFTGNVELTCDKNIKNPKQNRSDISFDFTEGLLNSFCKKDVSIHFEPKTRASLIFKVNIYAKDNTSNNNTEETKGKEIDLKRELNAIPKKEDLKCTLEITGKGDYPLIKIVDLRNNFISSSKLWKDFNVDLANEELQKKLTEEEINYANNKTNKKMEDTSKKLKLIKFDFGKHFLKREKADIGIQHQDVFLTLKNEGGVLSEFFFKFPGEINIKREIWMDPVEPTSNDKVEYHVLKEQIFSIEPKKSKLEPGESCNIRLRYNIKEKGKHNLRVIFQVVNGKPLIFELCSETLNDKNGVLLIPKKELDFNYVPIGYMNYITSPIELNNISSVKVKYYIDPEEINKFNEEHDQFEIFKINSNEGSIGPNETKFIIVYFRPLTNETYKMKLTLHFTDEVSVGNETITITGKGYHPLNFTPPPTHNTYEKMPNELICNNFYDNMIQKCGLNIEELDFGTITKTKNKTFILYNYSKESSFDFEFEFSDTGFLIKDELLIQPHKGTIEPNNHKIIKCILTPSDSYTSEYEGDLPIKIVWNQKSQRGAGLGNLMGKNLASKKITGLSNFGANLAEPLNTGITALNKGLNINLGKIDKEKIFLRISKKSKFVNDVRTPSPDNSTKNCIIENLLFELTKEILCSKEVEDSLKVNIDNQPLGLYEWTNNGVFPSQKDIRKRFLKNLHNNVLIQIGEVSNDRSPQKKGTSKQIELKYLHNSKHNTFVGKEKEATSDTENLKEDYNEELDYNIQDKYMKDVLNKYKYSIQELNEKLIVVNEDTRKILTDTIMENTIYNIISEAVYGETDLTEKTRIYFFVDKNKSNKNNNNLNNNLAPNSTIDNNKNNEEDP